MPRRMSLISATLSCLANLVTGYPSKCFQAQVTAIPDYALTYAPYTVLYSKEHYFPSDVVTHLEHTTPEVNYTAIADATTLADLNSLTTDAYLTSNDDVETNPSWLTSIDNKPDADGLSKAPATIIAVQKDGFVDVFYFYFYSFDFGNDLFGIVFGNHVGDWEHSMVRFVNGEPTHVYLSAHSSGYAYTYDAIAKEGKRPKVYVADGTHANYAITGTQEYTFAGSLITDDTDEGPFWDVALNYRGYWFDNDTTTFTIAGGAGTGGAAQDAEGAHWLLWKGAWGDQEYPEDDDRQYCVFDISCHYVNGPTGPLAKNLGRTKLCQNKDDCDILDSL
ncbi:hypothetical protein K523DRAFT_318928 [Schizophyllum commune Tattone D]|nr:hypothetical protein K523DRAFT_318928 [Schizophyllum commune Tattone D]